MRHEDLAHGPNAAFGSCWLGLPTPAQSSLPNARAPESSRGSGPYDIVRDPATTVDAWRERISASELDAIRDIVGATASRLYPDHEW